MVASNGVVPGSFADDSDFFYIEVLLNAFK
jgi:hypothetical protein